MRARSENLGDQVTDHVAALVGYTAIFPGGSLDTSRSNVSTITSENTKTKIVSN